MLKLCMVIIIAMSLGCEQVERHQSELDVLLKAEPKTWDPALFDPALQSLAPNLFENLLRVTSKGRRIEPQLAKSWRRSDDGLHYQFHLREEIEFHDGSPLTAHAVKAAFERQNNPQHPAHDAGKNYFYWDYFHLSKLIEKIEVHDQHRVDIYLSEPYSPFLYLLAMPFMSIPHPEALKQGSEEFSKRPLGTGPFEWAQRTDHSVRLRAFENHWNQPTRNEGVELYWEAPEGRSFDIEEGAGKDQTLSQSAHRMLHLIFHSQKEPTAQKEFRKAILQAVDLEKLIKDIYGIHAKASRHPLPPRSLRFSEKMPRLSLEKEQSAELFKQWNSKVILKIVPNQLIQNSEKQLKKLARRLKKNFKKLNLELTIMIHDKEENCPPADEQQAHLILQDITSPHGDPETFIDGFLQQPRFLCGWSHYRHPQLEEWIQRAREIPLAFNRAQLYQRPFAHLDKEYLLRGLAHFQRHVSLKPELEDYHMNFRGEHIFQKAILKQ